MYSIRVTVVTGSSIEYEILCGVEWSCGGHQAQGGRWHN